MWAARIILVILLGANEEANPIDMLSARDRVLQSQAVEALASNCGDCIPTLLTLWRTTNRFDIQMHVAMVFERLGPKGIPPLLELTRDVTVTNDHGMATLIARSLAASGPIVMDAVKSEMARPDSHIAAILFKLTDRLGVDRVEVVRKLIKSDVPRIRAQALGLSWVLPLPERTEVFIEAAQDANDQVRERARWQLPVWSRADQEQHPDDFERYNRALGGLLGSADRFILTSTARTLRQNGAKNAVAAETLPTIFKQLATAEERTSGTRVASNAEFFWLRVEAMTAYVVVHPETGEAVRTLLEELEVIPLEVCTALQYGEPQTIPKEALTDIVAALPRARGREATPAEDLLVRIGAPAVPTLIDALRADDSALSGHAAEALRRIGEAAKPAIQALVQQLKSRGRSWQGHAYVTALILIDIKDQSVRDALVSLISDPTRDPYVAGNALRDLIQKHGNEEWVRTIAEPALRVTDHPLHKFAMHYPPPQVAGIIAAQEEHIVKEFLDTSLRDAAWAFASGADVKEVELAPLTEERERRGRAANALAIVANPQDATIEALIAALSTEIIALPQPPGYGEYPEGDRRSNWKRILWDFERSIAAEIARALSTQAHRHSEVLRKVVEQLSTYHFALALVLSHPVADPSQPGQYEYLSVPPDLAGKAVEALVRYAREVTPFHARQGWIIAALGRLPSNDPRKMETLLDLIHFGEGKDGPAAALVSIGLTRPMTPEALDIIRQNLDDPRGEMAAIAAAGNAGEYATVLLDDLLVRGRQHMTYSSGCEVARAVERIAPGDPRVQSFLADYRSSVENHHKNLRK